MSKHTPGPWDWDQDDLGIWINATAAGYPEPIAKIGKAKRQPRQANARLIAAAPDLLEALSRCRGQWIHSVNAEQCLAAIAKATGHTVEEVRWEWKQ